MAKTKINISTKKTNSMSRFEKQGQSKIINSYGAVGTLIQTINNGSILISDFDTWPFYNFLRKNYQNKNAADYLIIDPQFIQDNRLVNRLAKELNINTLLGIFRMPENKYIPQNNTLKVHTSVISASFFPCWFYCPTCGNMNYYIRKEIMPGYFPLSIPPSPPSINIISEISFTIISLSSTDKLFMEFRFFIRN